MKAITIRFGDTTFAQIKDEAAREGMSMSAFIREAAYTRTILLRARRGEYPPAETEPLVKAVHELLAQEDLRRT